MVKSSAPAAGSAVHWPAVYAAIAVGLAVVLGLGGLLAWSVWLAPEGPAPEPVAQAAPQADVPASDIDLPFDEPEPRPAPRVVVAAPAPPPVPPPPEPEPVSPSAEEAAPAPVPAAEPAPVSVPAPVVRKAPPVVLRPAVKRSLRGLGGLDRRTEEGLLEELERMPELRFDSTPGTAARVRTEAHAAHKKGGKRELIHPAVAVLKSRADLRGLPVLEGSACLTGPAEAKVLETASRTLRRSRGRVFFRAGEGHEYWRMEPPDHFSSAVRKSARAKDEGGSRALVQLLQADNETVRLALVEGLSGRKGGAASKALAERAVFDLSPGVRAAAVKALEGRPREEARPTFLAALRYPWPPAAAHAAEALVALDDHGAAGDLKRLLRLADPDQPSLNPAGEAVVREVVRVNHLSNCMMCHAPSFERSDRVRGLVPEPGKPLREVYYEAMRGDFVRADVTYLRQDFSVMHRLEGAVIWPQWQRYDYLVRARVATPAEAAALRAAGAREAGGPYREAVLFALRYLEAPRPKAGPRK
jgi:hypothetical protein